MSCVALPFCHFLKVPYNWASSQLVNHLPPWFSLLSRSRTTLRNYRCLLTLRAPEMPQVQTNLPQHSSAIQQAVNECAALARLWFRWSGREEVFWVREGVPVQWRSGEHESIWQISEERYESATHVVFWCSFWGLNSLESVKLLQDSVPLDGGFVSPSLSSSLPPSVWSKETLSRALLRRCISSSPWGDEKLRAAMVERTSALCLLWLSLLRSRSSLWWLKKRLFLDFVFAL